MKRELIEIRRTVYQCSVLKVVFEYNEIYITIDLPVRKYEYFDSEEEIKDRIMEVLG